MADTPNRTTGTAPDQVAMQKQVADVAERTQAIFRAFMDRQSKGDVPPGFDHTTVSRAFRDWNAALMRDPGALMQANTDYWSRIARLFEAGQKRLMGETPEPVAGPAKGDNRFRDAAWSKDMVFDHLKQAYLIYSEYAQALPDQDSDLDPHTRQMVSFYTRR
jgi:polyhydroxyalkanoate synthase